MKFLKNSGLVIAAALAITACGNKVETVETTEAREVGEALGSAVQIDPSASEVGWTGYKPNGRHYGIIPLTTGELTVDGDMVTGGKFSFDITKLEVHDLEEGSDMHGKLSGHLQSEDFFDASNHPTASFEITSIEPYASGDDVEDKEEFVSEYTPKSAGELLVDNPTHWVSGNLTMRGTSKNIKFPASISVSNGAVGAKAGFNIDRTEWGLSYRDEAGVMDKAKDQFIYNTVNVNFDIKAN